MPLVVTVALAHDELADVLGEFVPRRLPDLGILAMQGRFDHKHLIFTDLRDLVGSQEIVVILSVLQDHLLDDIVTVYVVRVLSDLDQLFFLIDIDGALESLLLIVNEL